MEQTDIDKLKSVELGILKEFIRICDENSLKYFVLGGTALGAVRHKGFIPWDDDIDVALPRADYERFAKIAQSSLPENMFFQTYETDENCPFAFAKIRRSDTTYIETSMSNIKINHGIYMDIFPLDGYPKSKFARKVFAAKKKWLRFVISDIFNMDRSGENKLKRMFRKTAVALSPNYKALVKRLDAMYKKYPYEESDIAANNSGAWGIKEVVPKEYFGNGKKAIFENIEIVLPEKAHEYLTHLYGDYMTPPPKKKRVGHHYYTVLDFDKSYKEYIK